LKPVGLHSDEDAPVLDSPHDPPVSSMVSSKTKTVAVPSPTSSAVEFTATPTRDAEDEDSQPTTWTTWWGKLIDKLEAFKEWASELIDSKKNNHSSR